MTISLAKESPVALMFRSGAKGDMKQIGQLGGMRGELRSMDDKPLPLISRNFREGVTPFDFFYGSQAGRRTMCEKKLATAPAGAFTRNMIEVAYRVVIAKEDCGTSDGVEVRDYEPLKTWLELIKGGKLKIRSCISFDKKKLGRIPLADGRFRSVLTCRVEPPAVCAACYGHDLSTGKLPPIGYPVGILAGQSIGERGTQLTMRTFHTGGAKGGTTVEGFDRFRKFLNNSFIPVNMFEVDGNKIDSWTLLLEIIKGEITTSTNLASQINRNIEEIVSLESIREILLWEGHIVYEGAVHERHFEVILRAMLKYPGGKSDEVQNPFKADSKVGITGLERVAQGQGSFLAAASYRRALEVLADSALLEKEDPLLGLKEDIILGLPDREE